MAPTSDERREVAERLRACATDINGMIDFAKYLNHWIGVGDANVDGLFSVKSDRMTAEMTLETLADLIDPTCEVVPFDEESMRLPHCSRCGEPMLKPWPNFCPHCGARVTGGGKRR